jgi:hypothetical protein
VLPDCYFQVQLMKDCRVTFPDAGIVQLEYRFTHRASFYVTEPS